MIMHFLNDNAFLIKSNRLFAAGHKNNVTYLFSLPTAGGRKQKGTSA